MFIFDTRLPEGYDLTLNDFELWSEYHDAAGNSVRWLVKQAAYDAEHGVLRYEMKEVYDDGTERPSSEALKFTSLEALLTLAQNAGFEVVWAVRKLEPGATWRKPGGSGARAEKAELTLTGAGLMRF